MEKTKVLFLCTGNTCRSQMAEAFVNKKYGKDEFQAFSAGLEPSEIHPYTKKVLEEIGINIDDQYSKSFKEYMGKSHFDYLITVCSNAEKNCPKTFPDTGHELHWDFDDPASFSGTEEEQLNKFREVRDEIEKYIKAWILVSK